MKLASPKETISEYGSQYIRTSRDNEYFVFSKITKELRAAIGDSGRFAMIEAVNANSQLWTIIIADLTHSENNLPADVKAGLLSLAFFSLKLGRKILSDKVSADPLVEINISIMKGLRGDMG
ncbi:flagellar biosynthesis regulator FlaF [Paracoccus sp. (in: a-proteobacteria)]|uniref:flagellar biosynthesis regulator FlaF n=1 Tax=Paracoccus sp. TaxID=267 RepID=UPI002AFE014E|nr:flagellar biosynthesis regulator FlaF [Paracoccus sp. (in: a-proteobacteria)]